MLPSCSSQAASGSQIITDKYCTFYQLWRIGTNLWFLPFKEPVCADVVKLLGGEHPMLPAVPAIKAHLPGLPDVCRISVRFSRWCSRARRAADHPLLRRVSKMIVLLPQDIGSVVMWGQVRAHQLRMPAAVFCSPRLKIICLVTMRTTAVMIDLPAGRGSIAFVLVASASCQSHSESLVPHLRLGLELWSPAAPANSRPGPRPPCRYWAPVPLVRLQAMGPPSQAHQQAALPDAVETVARLLYCDAVAWPIARATLMRVMPDLRTLETLRGDPHILAAPELRACWRLMSMLQRLPWMTGGAAV